MADQFVPRDEGSRPDQTAASDGGSRRLDGDTEPCLRPYPQGIRPHVLELLKDAEGEDDGIFEKFFVPKIEELVKIYANIYACGVLENALQMYFENAAGASLEDSLAATRFLPFGIEACKSSTNHIVTGGWTKNLAKAIFEFMTVKLSEHKHTVDGLCIAIDKAYRKTDDLINEMYCNL